MVGGGGNHEGSGFRVLIGGGSIKVHGLGF